VIIFGDLISLGLFSCWIQGVARRDLIQKFKMREMTSYDWIVASYFLRPCGACQQYREYSARGNWIGMNLCVTAPGYQQPWELQAPSVPSIM
jgi:hypothetical protein